MKNKIYCGLDPGLTGALAVIINNGLVVYDLPIGDDGRIDSVRLYNLLPFRMNNEAYCYIEKSSAMPGQGVVSMFSYGVTYGIILDNVRLARIPIKEIHPREWKKEFGLLNKKGYIIKKDKIDSVEMATTLFPKYKDQFWRDKRGGGKIYLHGRAEATLIAEFCRRKEGSK